MQKQALRDQQHKMTRRGWLSLALSAMVGACTYPVRHERETETIQLPPDTAGPAPGAATPSPRPSQNLRIVILKSDRILEMYAGQTLTHRYHVGLGFHPRGDKRRQGDGRTPVGNYAIVVKNPKSRFFLSLGLNYPSLQDASKAYVDKRISWAQYRAIARAFSDDKVPPWHTALGGEIFIHGDGGWHDWTQGCIALDNPAMRELYNVAEVGTPVVIRP